MVKKEDRRVLMTKRMLKGAFKKHAEPCYEVLGDLFHSPCEPFEKKSRHRECVEAHEKFLIMLGDLKTVAVCYLVNYIIYDARGIFAKMPFNACEIGVRGDFSEIRAMLKKVLEYRYIFLAPIFVSDIRAYGALDLLDNALVHKIVYIVEMIIEGHSRYAADVGYILYGYLVELFFMQDLIESCKNGGLCIFRHDKGNP